MLTLTAEIFLNHYYALDAYIQEKNDLADLVTLKKFSETKSTNPDDYKSIAKLLLNAWSAEYALRITPVVNDEQYLQSSLHWTFPQAYYSVLFSVRAFLFSQGIKTSNEDKIRKEVAKLVVNNAYPESIGFYTFRQLNDFRTCRLKGKADTVEAIKTFLESTRIKHIKQLRSQIQTNPKTALRRPSSGEIIQRFGPNEYYQLSRLINTTTYFDLLCRLRISSTNREIERFVDSELDVRKFHTSLVSIVTHINTIHERYVIEAIGTDAFKEIEQALPSYLREGFLIDRKRP